MHTPRDKSCTFLSLWDTHGSTLLIIVPKTMNAKCQIICCHCIWHHLTKRGRVWLGCVWPSSQQNDSVGKISNVNLCLQKTNIDKHINQYQWGIRVHRPICNYRYQVGAPWTAPCGPRAILSPKPELKMPKHHGWEGMWGGSLEQPTERPRWFFGVLQCFTVCNVFRYVSFDPPKNNMGKTCSIAATKRHCCAPLPHKPAVFRCWQQSRSFPHL